MYKNIKVKSKFNSYSINFVDSLTSILELTNYENTFTFIDEKVSSIYKDLDNDRFIKVKCVEENKSMDGVNEILKEFVKHRINIKSKLVVIGGGILQDLIGFCASIYCRGIDYILVPTTILSQVDSCVGGKTSINFENKKNILGSFYPPKKIYIYKNFVKSLTNLDVISGYGEIFKFYILQNRIIEFNFETDYEEMLINSLNYKTKIIVIDEFDQKERKFLNFGHTFGHALETISDYEIPHGIGVIIGSVIATKISLEYNYQPKNYQEIIHKGLELLKKTNLKFKKEWFDLQKLLDIIKTDKKSIGKLTMVLMSNEPLICDIGNITTVEKVLKEIYEII
jgi:3-dehydroquinate synthase